MGTTELVTLTDQSQGFQLREVWRSPAAVFSQGRRLYAYSPVWFENLGRKVNAEGDRVVRVNATLRWGGRPRLI